MRKVLYWLLLAAAVLVAGAGKPNRRDGDRLSDYTMASTIYWTGQTGDGNWNTTTNWSGGALPVTGDTVYVSRNAKSGMWSNLDRTGDGTGAGLNLVLFEIESGCKQTVGTSSANRLQLTADEFVDRGSADVWFRSNTGTAALDTDILTVDKPDNRVTCNIDDNGGSSSVTDLRVTGGNVIFSGLTTLSKVYLVPDPANGETFLEINSTGLVSTIYVAGGTLINRAELTTNAYFSAGHIILGSAIAGSTSTNVYQSGGLVEFDPNALTYNAGSYLGLGGTLDASLPVGSTHQVTLTAGPQFEFLSGPRISYTITLLGN